MKDILRLGHQYGVSHLMIFSSTKKSLLPFLLFSDDCEDNYLRLAKTPKGPTLAFKIINYSLIKDILNQ